MKFETKGDFPKYIPIGGTFMFKGKKYKCIQGNRYCSIDEDINVICSLHKLEGGICDSPKFCTPAERKDNNEIIYRLIE